MIKCLKNTSMAKGCKYVYYLNTVLAYIYKTFFKDCSVYGYKT